MVAPRSTKRFVPIFLACLFAAGVITFAATYPRMGGSLGLRPGSNTYVAPSWDNADQKGAVSAVLSQAAQSDQDKDGLKDWEEALWKSNPQNKDSDGDGTDDGAEVAAGRNPTVKGPNDALSTNPGPSKDAESNSEPENTTLTDRLGKELFEQYLVSKKNGTFNQDALIRGFVEEQSDALEPTLYTAKDIITLNTTSPETLRAYGNGIGKVLASYPTPRGSKNEFEIVKNAIDTSNPRSLDALSPIITSYEGIIRDMRAVPVPQDIARDHLELINSLQAVLGDIRGFQKTFTDPIVGLISLNNYMTNVLMIQDAFANIDEIFEQEGIVFEQSEYGYLISRVI